LARFLGLWLRPALRALTWLRQVGLRRKPRHLSRAARSASLFVANIVVDTGTAVHGELNRVSQALTGRVKELAERYGRTMPELAQQVDDLEARVARHLAKMGFAWK
jgi:hypothetical protein